MNLPLLQLLIFLSITLAQGAVAKESLVIASSFDDEMASAFGGEQYVSIATGRQQNLYEAPAVATVITAADIKAMGATDLDEVLETIPGMHVSISPTSNSKSIYVMRGIISDYNPHVLIQIDGVPITSLLFGNRGQAWGGMPIENIARIEVIRGPGSAIYGADAFSGVINIIPKSRAEIADLEGGVRAGSFNTVDAWLLTNTRWQNLDVASSLQGRVTDGYDKTIERDLQSVLDSLTATNASYAPGKMNNQGKSLDASFSLANDVWHIYSWYQMRRALGTGPGVAEALDPAGYSESDRIGVNFVYDRKFNRDRWRVSSQLSYYDASFRLNLVALPPGANNFVAVFPEGMIGRPSYYERHLRMNNSFYYYGLQDHTLRVGFGGEYGNQYRVEEVKNFDTAGNNIGSLMDVTDTPDIYTPEKVRVLAFSFVQDEWYFLPDWTLTGGLRADYYSDFGATVNPRLALVTQLNRELSLKLLYGRAFRSPSFAELYNTNNPLTLGNATLKPETIDTVEVSSDYHPGRQISSRLGAYLYKTKDVIRFVADPLPATSSTAQNLETQKGYGVEWDASLPLMATVNLNANASIQRTFDTKTHKQIAKVPRKKLYARADWRPIDTVSTNLQLNWARDRTRAGADARPAVKNSFGVDYSIRYQPSKRGMAFAGLVKNVFDADLREPSPDTGSIANDIPLSGRSFMLEARYSY